MAYTVTDYLLDRLHEVGAGHIFGVPGDFTLGMLDHVEDDPRIQWVGTANELGAGYAADGYARVRHIGALCTTFGVGELSAINAVAGSYAEHVPVLHIVGAPATVTQAAGRATHHTLGTGDFRTFARMSTEVTAVEASLTPENAEAEIDRVLAGILEQRLPGYLLIPTNVGAAPATPPAAPLARQVDVTDPEALEQFRDAAEALLSGASSLAILADILVQRMGAEDAFHRLLAETAAPHATLLWGRRVVDESASNYLGTYNGAVSDPAVRGPIEDSDALILAGVQFTDLTSAFFSENIDTARTIDAGARSASVAGVEFGPIALKDALAALVEVAGRVGTPASAVSPPRHVHAEHDASDALSQESLWDTVSERLLPGDLVLADQGTSFYGMGAHRLPHDLLFIGQPLWASIGFSLPALLGASLGAPQRRPIVLIGDGAAQLTIAELGTLLRQHVNAVVLIVDNAGYTVERAIHGPEASYNDIARWDWAALVAAMGPDENGRAIVARTVGELRDAFDVVGPHPDRLTLIQAIVPPLDVPPLLSALAAAVSSANARPQHED